MADETDTTALEANYFDRYDSETQAGEPGLLERARLNTAEGYYRGTLDTAGTDPAVEQWGGGYRRARRPALGRPAKP